MRIRPEAEDSLENTLNCVPKVQGGTLNLSGKRTEKYAKVRAVPGLLCSPLIVWGLLFIW